MSLYMLSDTLCSSVLAINKNIQSVILINKQGRPIEKISKPKFARQFPDSTNEMFLMQTVLQVSMGRDFDEQYGPINYYFSERNNITMLTFPFDDHVILVALKKSVSPISIARKITCMMDEYRKQF